MWVEFAPSCRNGELLRMECRQIWKATGQKAARPSVGPEYFTKSVSLIDPQVSDQGHASRCSNSRQNVPIPQLPQPHN